MPLPLKISKILILGLLLTALISCQEEDRALTADKIIDKAIENAGGEKYERASIDFVFRKAHYTSSRKDGLYTFTRTRKDSLGVVKDILNNEGVQRYRNDREVEIPDSLVTTIGEGVNSVHYFVQLPYGLNDPAVQKELVGEDEIKGEPYYEIKVSFEEEGGGSDHEDVYMYWIHKDDFTIDYLAYRFYVNDGGIRFREAYNPRRIEGIRFVDYENYKTNDLSTPLERLDDLFETGELIRVSTIENEIKKVELQD